MSKSTPINQLPTQSIPQTAFVNDQQRQMITQAQQAIGNSTMPQNTQISSEMLNEDDAVIQDMLNNLNTQQEPSYVQQHQTLQGQQMPQSQDDLLRYAAMNNLNINQLMGNGYGPTPYQAVLQQPSVALGNVPIAKQFTTMITSEMKLVGFVFLAVVLVHFIPFHKIVSKYIALDKIPYHDVLIRASLAAMIVIIMKKLFSS